MGHDRTQLASFLLRLGLATVLIYAATASLLRPNEWVGYIPHAIVRLVDANLVLKVMSGYELILAWWLLVNWQVRYAAAVCAATLAAITFSNLQLFAVSFRDIGLVFAALALMVLESGSGSNQDAKHH